MHAPNAASSSAPGMPDGSIMPSQKPSAPPPARAPGFISALGNIGGAFKAATKSGVLWLILLLVIAQIMLAAAYEIATMVLVPRLAIAVLTGFDLSRNIVPIAILGGIALGAIIMFNTQLSLLGPLRQALLKPDDQPRGFVWAIKETARSSLSIWLWGVLFGIIFYIPSAMLFYTDPRMMAPIIVLGTLAAAPLIPLPWFIAARIGPVAAVKSSFKILFRYWLSFLGYFATFSILALSLSCITGIFTIIPILGDIIAFTIWILFGLSTLCVYASLMAMLEADMR